MEQYQLIKQLGSGSFGRVIKARRKTQNNGQYVAIKLIKMTNLSEKEKDSALNQIRLLASISSPNVVSYHTAFFDQPSGNLCIVMEFADGGDLAGLINKKREKGLKFNQNFIWQVAHDLLRALKILHSNKIIHRDIKPGNVFFVNGVAKLGDLNISKVMEGSFASTQAGTPYYTSPQIWNGQLYDGKCDIWSLGCLLYQISSLRPPFLANDFAGLSKKVNIGYYDPIPIVYSRRLSDLIRGCLKVNPSERPFAADLLQDSVFQFMQTTEEGSVNLLDTIRCPKVLKLIQHKLPVVKSLLKVQQVKQEDSLIQKPGSQIKKLLSVDRYADNKRYEKQQLKEKQNELKLNSIKSTNRSEIKSPIRNIIQRLQSPKFRNRPTMNSPPPQKRFI